MHVLPLPNMSAGVDSAITAQPKLTGKANTLASNEVIDADTGFLDDGEAVFGNLLIAAFGFTAPVVVDEVALAEADVETAELPTIDNGKNNSNRVSIEVLGAPRSSNSGEQLATKSLFVPTSKNIDIENAVAVEEAGVPEAIAAPKNDLTQQVLKPESVPVEFSPQAATQSVAKRGAAPNVVNSVQGTPDEFQSAVDSEGTDELNVESIAPRQQKQHNNESANAVASVSQEETTTQTNALSASSVNTKPSKAKEVTLHSSVENHVDLADSIARPATVSDPVATRFSSTLNQAAATKANPVHVANTVTAAVLTSTTRGDSRVEVRLDPPELGNVWIELTSTEDGLSAKIVSEHDTTSHLLQEHISTLRRSLSDSGITVTDFSFDTGAHSSGRERSTPESEWGRQRSHAESNNTGRSASAPRGSQQSRIGIDVLA